MFSNKSIEVNIDNSNNVKDKDYDERVVRHPNKERESHKEISVGVIDSNKKNDNILSEINGNHDLKPRLAVYGYYADDLSASKESRPEINALRGKSPLANTYVFYRYDWEMLDKKIIGIENRMDQDEAQRMYENKRYTLLPGMLAFVIQNISSKNSPEIVIKNMVIKTDIKKTFKKINEELVLYEFHAITAGAFVTATDGKVNINSSRIFHPIVMPKKPETSIYRDRLKPGDESFYAIDIDVDLEGEFFLDLDLEVYYYYVDANGVKHDKAIIKRIIAENAIKPPIHCIKKIYYGTIFKHYSVDSTSVFTYEDIYDYSGRDHM